MSQLFCASSYTCGEPSPVGEGEVVLSGCGVERRTLVANTYPSPSAARSTALTDTEQLHVMVPYFPRGSGLVFTFLPLVLVLGLGQLWHGKAGSGFTCH